MKSRNYILELHVYEYFIMNLSTLVFFFLIFNI